MKKVLIALDYDPTAQKVAERGFSLAKALKAEVILLHVVKCFSELFHPRTFSDHGLYGLRRCESHCTGKWRRTQICILYNILIIQEQHLGDKTIQTMVEEGNYAETILKCANEVHADLIVIGSHSQKWLENILMGSVTEEVLKDSSIPLYIIPTKKDQ